MTDREPPDARTPRLHLTEYAGEMLGLGLFMVSACAFAILLWHPSSPVSRAIPNELARRALMGLAMGLTLVANVNAPWGRRSGAHLNPAVTFAFWRLRRASLTDFAGYTLAQVAGGILGVALVAWLAGPLVADPSVDWVVTRPGPAGVGVAFVAELAIAFVLFSVVLRVMASPRRAALTPWAAGILLASYITFESPLSGTSMNPARTLGSALFAHDFRAFWIYVAAPPLAMLAAVELWRAELRARDRAESGCAKLLHLATDDCHFCGQRGTGRKQVTGTSADRGAFTTGRRSA